MNDDRFTNLEKDIMRSVGRILSSQELSDLKYTIFSAIDQVEQVTQKTARTMEKAADKVEQASHKAAEKAANSARNSYYQPYNGGRVYSNRSQRENPPSNYGKNSSTLQIKGSVSSGLWLAFSICGIVIGASLTLLGLVFSLLGHFSSFFGGALLFLAASIVSTVFAGKKLGQVGRFRKYLKAIGQHPMYTVKEISSGSGIPETKVQQELPKLLSAVSFPFAKLDEERTCLILEKETYQQYLDLKETRRRLEEEENRKKARLAADPNAAAVEQMKQDGMEYLHKIRMVNDALPEQEISEKLDKLENICRKIFSYVEQHPNKLPQIRKLMCYYLPTTLKLVESYEQLESHRISTASIEESKVEIHSALDNINLAFENLFDKLLQNDLMDLSADISVLETMLAQEGLTDHDHNINAK